MGVRPSRVRRLRARRARRRAAWASFVSVTAVVAATVTLSGSGSSGAPASSRAAESRPTVQGSTSVRTAPLRTVAAPNPVASMFSVDTASEASVEQGVGVWVAARRGLGALGALKLSAEAAPSAIPPSRLVLQRPVAVLVEVQGKDLDELTNAATVGQLLSAMGIEPDGDDRVAPPLQTPLHFSEVVRFDRVDLRSLTVTSNVDYAVHTTSTSSLLLGQVRVATPGIEGQVSRTYRVRLVNGREVSRMLVSQTVLRAAVDEVREVGTAQPSPTPPPPTTPPAPRPSPTTPAPTPPATPGPSSHTESGQATWYDTGTPGMYAAHPWLPFGTHVTVTDLANGKTVTVVINDRGPFGGRIIDLSSQAFALLAPLPTGVIDVRLTW